MPPPPPPRPPKPPAGGPRPDTPSGEAAGREAAAGPFGGPPAGTTELGRPAGEAAAGPPRPGPNPRLAPAGPAVGSAPVWLVRTVDSVYAVGAASPTTIAGAEHREPEPSARRHEQRDRRAEPEDEDDRAAARAPSPACGRAARRPRSPVAASVTASATRREPAVAVPPHQRAADADERADRGHEGDRVVLVDDPLAEADRHAGHEQPAAPEDERGTGAVGARAPQREHEARHEQDERGRDAATTPARRSCR